LRLILQRVSRAVVRVEGETIGEIGRGLLVLVGIERGDGPEQVVQAAAKLAALRVFEDRHGKMNLALREVGGGVLLVSQFTLAGTLRRGRRPSFERAAPPEIAAPLIERMADELVQRSVPVASGRFGARMAVESVNDGPVTFVLEFPPEGESGASR
jgi:D-tyrosyl-tRNA(Tyr) deacylase